MEVWITLVVLDKERKGRPERYLEGEISRLGDGLHVGVRKKKFLRVVSGTECHYSKYLSNKYLHKALDHYVVYDIFYF